MTQLFQNEGIGFENSFGNLPIEMNSLIFHKLNIKDYFNCRLVCNGMKKIVESDYVFKDLFKQFWECKGLWFLESYSGNLFRSMIQLSQENEFPKSNYWIIYLAHVHSTILSSINKQMDQEKSKINVIIRKIRTERTKEMEIETVLKKLQIQKDELELFHPWKSNPIQLANILKPKPEIEKKRKRREEFLKIRKKSKVNYEPENEMEQT